MIYTPTPLPGAYVIELEAHADERGFFARTFCAQEFARNGLCTAYAQCSISFNARAGTLRGMHFQARPHAEAKLVRATQGAVYDVILDLRQDSPAYLRWFAVELSAENRKTLYIPEGLAHGFQTLTDGAELFYQISVPYQPDAARGVRWNDPAFGIEWPRPVADISDRDCGFPALARE